MMQQESENTQNSEVKAEVTEREDVQGLKRALAEAEKKAGEYLAGWQRAQADFVNFKRRSEQEKEDFCRFASADLIQNLLPVLDDLERALGSMPSQSGNDKWLEGIRLVERKFKTVLEARGVAPVKALGEPFDPAVHEALRQDKGKEGIIIEEIQKGYMMHDRLLRPAKVVVGMGEGVAKEES